MQKSGLPSPVESSLLTDDLPKPGKVDEKKHTTLRVECFFKVALHDLTLVCLCSCEVLNM